MKDSPGYKEGPIRLISCETGAKDAITAQYFANYMGVKIMAPTDIVYVFRDGQMIIGRRNTGTWKIFKPKEW